MADVAPVSVGATPKVLKNVQALRAVAALLVVLDHVNTLLVHSDPNAKTLLSSFGYFGGFGVDLFFAISGFIMVTTNWNAFERPRAGVTFLFRRIARIYPPYWIVLVPIALAYLVAPHALMRAHEGRSDVVASLLLLPQSTPPLLLVSWTLTFEMFFYAVFATVLRAKRARLRALLAVWIALEIVASIVLHGSRNPYLEFLSNPLPLEFICGAFVGYAYRCGTMPAARACALSGVSLAACIWFANARFGFAIDLSSDDFRRVLVFGIPSALIVYGAIGREMRFGSRVPAWLVSFGDASYSTYLLHLPLIVLLGALASRLHVRGAVPDLVAQSIDVILTMGVSLIAYRYVEKPVTRLASRAIPARLGGVRAIHPRTAAMPAAAIGER